MLRNFFLESKDRFEVHTKTHAIEKCRNQVRFQNGQVIDLAILKPGFELAMLDVVNVSNSSLWLP